MLGMQVLDVVGPGRRPPCAGLRFMELRHTAVTRMHESGVDALGITVHSANTVKQIL